MEGSSAQWTLERRVLLVAALFAAVAQQLQWGSLQLLSASMDQGIFLQVLWNDLRGHPFESTLSSQLSTNVMLGEQLPALGYHRLGQHFTPILMLWVPLVGLLGNWALPLVQVGLMTAAGLVLFRLARQRLDPAPASWTAISFFAANAVIGPTWRCCSGCWGNRWCCCGKWSAPRGGPWPTWRPRACRCCSCR